MKPGTDGDVINVSDIDVDKLMTKAVSFKFSIMKNHENEK